jgi:hypothetical protein
MVPIDDGQCNRGLCEHGDVSCFDLCSHRLGVCSHLVGAGACGKSAGCTAGVAQRALLRHQKPMPTRDFSHLSHECWGCFGPGSEVCDVVIAHCDGPCRGEEPPSEDRDSFALRRLGPSSQHSPCGRLTRFWRARGDQQDLAKPGSAKLNIPKRPTIPVGASTTSSARAFSPRKQSEEE